MEIDKPYVFENTIEDRSEHGRRTITNIISLSVRNENTGYEIY